MYKNNLLNKFFIEKDFIYLIQSLSETTNHYEKNILAKCYMELKDYNKAANIFYDADMLYESGRCFLLMGEMQKTKEIWSQIKEETPATLWGKSLLEFINLYVINIPTFFQIRAFLEVDLDALLNANLINYCENIANGAHIFARNNQESYKFIGRVFLNNNYFDLAKLYLNEAKKICYIDPEVHYLIAKCHINDGNKQDAIESLKTSIEKGYGYYPAKKLLENINMAWNKAMLWGKIN